LVVLPFELDLADAACHTVVNMLPQTTYVEFRH